MLFQKYFALSKKKAIGLLFLIPIASAIEISVSYLLQIITDTATGKGFLSYKNLVLVVFLYILVDASSYFYTSFLQQITLNQITNRIRNKLLISILHRQTGVGQNAQATTNDYYNDFNSTIEILRSDFLQGSLNFYKQICQLLIALVLSILIKPMLTFWIVLLCIPGIFLPFFRQKSLSDNKQRVIETSKQNTSRLQDILGGLRTIQLFSFQKLFFKIFHHQNSELLLAQNKDQLTRKEIDGVSQLLNDFLYLGTWVIGIYFVLKREISLGQLVAFSQLMIFISEPIQSASGLIGDILGGKEAAKKIYKKLDTANKQTKNQNLTTLKSITYQNVSYQDHQKNILNNISIQLEKNKHYLIVGKSGSGKSTLLNLPLSDVKISGNILLNKTPISQFDLADIYQHIGLLEQSSYIFDDTLRNNLSLFSTKYSNEELITVLNTIGLRNYADPTSLKIKVDAHSNSLSGGERRRIALGRLLLKSNEFNFFDEPLTGLDPKTSHEISQILNNLMSGWLTVTHQFDEELFQNANEIIILDSGQIKAQGLLSDKKIQAWLKELRLIS